MARIKVLTARQVETFPPGFYADGGNLYLRVRPKVSETGDVEAGSRAWVFRYKLAGRVVELGLGPVEDRDIRSARDVAGKMRSALADGEDPAAVLKRRDGEAKTFKEYALELIAAKKTGWRNAKHIQQWGNTLETYAYPKLGHKQPREITLADVKGVLEPLWTSKTETAVRLRQRIEAVLDYAAVHEEDDRRNPARWRGNLDKVLQAPRKLAKPEHHAAAAHGAVPKIMEALRDKDSTSALCLRFTVLTAARSGEARGALWSEIDLKGRMWVIPAKRMKAGREHRVPLSDEAVEILEKVKPRKAKDCDLVFPGARAGLLSDVAVNKTLHAIAPGVTVHGFRSSFREWGAEETSFASAVLELALAHVDTNKVQAAYQRSDLLERRKQLMETWAAYCGGKPAEPESPPPAAPKPRKAPKPKAPAAEQGSLFELA